jgi:hypothetical protein
LLKVAVQLGCSRDEHPFAFKEGSDEVLANVWVMFVTITGSEHTELAACLLRRLVYFFECARVVFGAKRSRTERGNRASRMCTYRAGCFYTLSVEGRVDRLLEERGKIGFICAISFSVLTKQEHVFINNGVILVAVENPL